MTSKAELRRALSASGTNTSNYFAKWHEESVARYKAEKERDAFKDENAILARAVEHAAEHHDELVQFIDDLFTIEPQLKHTLTNGVWDFERVHRAAEALRAEDALASVGYTDQCVEWPDNVTPLFPHRPDGEVA